MLTSIDNSEQEDGNISSVSWVDDESSVMYYCKLSTEVCVENINEDKIIKTNTPCDVCDSHGKLMIKIDCDCGVEHQLNIKVW